jgi:hypothetical protein
MFEGECNYCHKQGHMAKDCYKKKKDEGAKSSDKAEKANLASDKKDDEEIAFTSIDFSNEGPNTGLCRPCSKYDFESPPGLDILSSKLLSINDPLNNKKNTEENYENEVDDDEMMITFEDLFGQQDYVIVNQDFVVPQYDDLKKIIDLKNKRKELNGKREDSSCLGTDFEGFHAQMLEEKLHTFQFGGDYNKTEGLKLEPKIPINKTQLQKSCDQSAALVMVNSSSDNKPNFCSDNVAMRSTDHTKTSEWDGFYIADSGATTHMTGSDQGMFDCEEINEKIKVGNGAFITAHKKGKIRAYMRSRDGTTASIVLRDVLYTPELAPASLFSITSALSNGWSLGSEGTTILLKKDGFIMRFDSHIKTKRGYICGVKLDVREENIATTAIMRGTTLNIMKYHDTMAHVSEATTKATAKYYGIKLVGNFEVCGDCARAKARQKNIPKINTGVTTTTKGERLLFDISSIRSTSYGGSKFWLLIIDDYTDKSWSYFLTSKAQLSTKLLGLIKHLKATYGIQVKYLRCDNAGENKKARDEAEKQGLGLTTTKWTG